MLTYLSSAVFLPFFLSSPLLAPLSPLRFGTDLVEVATLFNLLYGTALCSHEAEGNTRIASAPPLAGILAPTLKAPPQEAQWDMADARVIFMRQTPTAGMGRVIGAGARKRGGKKPPNTGLGVKGDQGPVSVTDLSYIEGETIGSFSTPGEAYGLFARALARHRSDVRANPGAHTWLIVGGAEPPAWEAPDKSKGTFRTGVVCDRMLVLHLPGATQKYGSKTTLRVVCTLALSCVCVCVCHF